MVERIHRVVVEGARIRSPRLNLRPWQPDDVEGALRVYGRDDVSRWLAPAMERVSDAGAMRVLLDRWVAEAGTLETPQGRWAVELRETGELIGGAALLPLPPHGNDLEIGWQLAPEVWGNGYAAEAGHAVAHQAFESPAGVDELFAVVRPRNERGAATARRVGMEWVGETDKYYGLQLQVYRVRKGDLDTTGLTTPPQ
jgi:RimJ/RimL family protein N-acetyltransferase